MRLFWRHGFEGTSLGALTAAMGINRPSLYAAFGNKEALFRRAVDRYVERTGGLLGDALAQPTARQAAEHLLRGAALGGRSGDGDEAPGCLLVQAALACGASAEPVRLELVARRGATEAALRRRFERATADGDLPPGTCPAELAKYVATVLHGLAVQSAGGAGPAELLPVVDLALRVWPAGARGGQ
ncbi:MAG: transcriptional regulator [Phycisphaerales bacterium]|nr:transcriptional regulator [Phycisphaerales bacterium]